MAAPTSRTVCLRAFNEDLITSNEFRPKTPPPPVPTRIAWPGGKIVSNKDEALANFLRRKLDQGQTLTPEQRYVRIDPLRIFHEALAKPHTSPFVAWITTYSTYSVLTDRCQIANIAHTLGPLNLGDVRSIRLRHRLSHTQFEMTMLEKMVEPNRSGSVETTCAFAPGSKRVLNGSGGGVTAEARVSVAKARSLLKKLDDKVARASNPEESTARGSNPASTLHLKRRTVDMSFIKNRSTGKTSNTVLQSTTKSAAAAIEGSKARRVLPDGQGGFSIETVLSLNAAGAGPCRPREGNKRPVTSSAREIIRVDMGALNSGAVATVKGRDKTKRKAFAPKGGRGGKKAKKISSNASATTAGGKKGNIGGGSCAAQGAGSRSLAELMTGGLAARR